MGQCLLFCITLSNCVDSVVTAWTPMMTSLSLSHDSRSTCQIIADRLWGQLRITFERLEKEAHSLTHVPFRSWCSVCQRAKGQQHYNKGSIRRFKVWFSLTTHSTRFQREFESLKVLTFVETVTLMSRPVIVPDLSAKQVAIKALKQFIAVSGFTKSFLNVMITEVFSIFKNKLLDLFRFPLRSAFPCSHQSQGTVESRRWEASRDSLWSSQSHQDWPGRSSRSLLRLSRRFFHAMDHSTCSLSDQQVSGQIRWEHILPESRQKSSKIAHCSYRRACSCSHLAQPPA